MLMPLVVQGQLAPIPPGSAEARALLNRRGIDEEALRARLRAQGMNVDTMTPEELIAARPAIEAAAAELEAETTSSQVDTALAGAEARAIQRGLEDATEIADAVESGSTVAEAEAEVDLPADTRPDASGIYGHSLFKGQTLDVFRASEQARAPSSYVLDSGDELAVTIFGPSQVDLLLEIDSDGFIRADGLPRIYLKGRTLGEARELVRSRLRDFYVFGAGQFSLTVNAARTITVGVYGEVERGGTYTLSSLNGALNAIVAAGGVTDRGSVREIELTREGRTTYIDAYDFLERPGEVQSFDLRDNDVINVPLADQIVEIRGGVRRPLRYELLPEEDLARLLSLAGGARPRAAIEATRVTRYEDGQLNVIDLAPERFDGFDLFDGDVVEVPVVEAPIENYVKVEGAVLVGGRFGFREDLSLADVLDRARARPTARQDLAFLRRRNDDGTTRLLRLDLTSARDLATELRRGDVVTVLDADRFVDEATVTIEGAVRDGSLTLPFPQEGGISLEEGILLAGGLTTSALEEALVIRTPRTNSELREYLRVPLEEARLFNLEPLDRISIYPRERYSDDASVSISGAVRNPGEFRYDASLTLSDLIFLAGGLRMNASRNRVEVYRLSIEEDGTKTLSETLSIDADGGYSGAFSLRPFDEVIVRSSAEFEEIQTVELAGEVRYPGVYARQDGQNRVSDFIERAGGLTSEAFAAGGSLERRGAGIGFVVLGLDEILDNPSGPANITLREGDRLVIPKPQELVRIVTEGTLANRFGGDSTTRDGILEVAYQGPHDAAWYIERYAGGFDDEVARRYWTTVELASGQVKETRGALGIRDYPTVERGATVRAGLKPVKVPKPERPRSSWGEIAQATLAGLTSLVTLIILIDRI